MQVNESAKIYKALVGSFREQVGFDGHHIKSFNEFVEKRVQKIFGDIGEIQLETPDLAEFKIRLGKVRMPKPNIKEADGAVKTVTPN